MNCATSGGELNFADNDEQLSSLNWKVIWRHELENRFQKLP